MPKGQSRRSQLQEPQAMKMHLLRVSKHCTPFSVGGKHWIPSQTDAEHLHSPAIVYVSLCLYIYMYMYMCIYICVCANGSCNRVLLLRNNMLDVSGWSPFW